MSGERVIDWEKIEADFRAGRKTLRVIGEEHGLSHVAIAKRAKRDNWVRDLSWKIAALAQEKVTKASVNSLVTKTTEKEIIEAESEIQARVALAHRKDIPQKRQLVAALFNELRDLTDNQDLAEQLVLALESGDQDRLAETAQRVASLPSRIKGVSELMNAYKTVIALERQAFGIENGPSVDGDSSNCIEIKFRGNAG